MDKRTLKGVWSESFRKGMWFLDQEDSAGAKWSFRNMLCDHWKLERGRVSWGGGGGVALGSPPPP